MVSTHRRLIEESISKLIWFYIGDQRHCQETWLKSFTSGSGRMICYKRPKNNFCFYHVETLNVWKGHLVLSAIKEKWKFYSRFLYPQCISYQHKCTTPSWIKQMIALLTSTPFKELVNICDFILHLLQLYVHILLHDDTFTHWEIYIYIHTYRQKYIHVYI